MSGLEELLDALEAFHGAQVPNWPTDPYLFRFGGTADIRRAMWLARKVGPLWRMKSAWRRIDCLRRILPSSHWR